jgi:hypothetical protein
LRQRYNCSNNKSRTPCELAKCLRRFFWRKYKGLEEKIQLTGAREKEIIEQKDVEMAKWKALVVK